MILGDEKTLGQLRRKLPIQAAPSTRTPPLRALAKLQDTDLPPWAPVSDAEGIVATAAAAALVLAVLVAPAGWVPVLDPANTLFHEAGHVIYGIFGETLALYGGTLGQLTFPVITLGSFWRRRQPGAVAVAILWFCENLFNIARYMADARAQELPLIGGGEHDWFHILQRWGALASDHRLARITRGLGWCGTALALAWLGWRWYGDMRRAATGPGAKGETA